MRILISMPSLNHYSKYYNLSSHINSLYFYMCILSFLYEILFRIFFNFCGNLKLFGSFTVSYVKINKIRQQEVHKFKH